MRASRLSMSGLENLSAPKEVLGSSSPRSSFSVSVITNTILPSIFGCDTVRVTGRRMSVVAAPELTNTSSAFPVQVRDLISGRTRDYRAAKAAAHDHISRPDLAPPTPVSVPASFLAPPKPCTYRKVNKARSPPPGLSTIDESPNNDPPLNDHKDTSDSVLVQLPTEGEPLIDVEAGCTVPLSKLVTHLYITSRE